MTDFIDNLLTSMSTKFNETKELVSINLNDDKTLKWRGLHNNQYASAKKRKDGKRSTQPSNDDPPLNSNDSSSSTATTETVTPTATTSTEKIKTTATDSINVNATDDINVVVNNDNVDSSNDLNSSPDKNLVSITDKDNKMNTEKDIMSVENKSDVRPVRRTLRRKHVDDANDDINLNVQNKKPVRAKRHLFVAGTINSDGEVPSTTLKSDERINSSKSDDKTNTSKLDEKSSSTKSEEKTSVSKSDEKQNTPNAISTDVKMTRRRARTRQSENVIDVNQTQVNSTLKAQEEIATNIPDPKTEINESTTTNAETVPTPSPPKLRRSERTQHAFTSTDHKDVAISVAVSTASSTPDDKNELNSENVSTSQEVKQDDNQSSVDNDSLKRFRKKVATDTKKTTEIVADEKKKSEKTNNQELSSSTTRKSTDIFPESTSADLSDDKKQNFEDLITTNEIKKSELSEAQQEDPTTSVPRKRGRKPGAKLKAKPDVKVNVAIGTRSSPAKKSPRFTNDESSFSYTLPKKDKNLVEQPVPHQRLSRRIKPTPKILANEELRQGFELQNNARLSLSSEHLDNEIDRSPKQEVQNHTETINRTTTEPTLTSTSEVNDKKSQINAGKSKPPTPPTVVIPGYMYSARRRCPEPEEFLNEIKLAKINLHRSPEDNKKLNLKQKKRLFKLKEKHLQKLGLQKTTKVQSKHSSSDSNPESDDNEEFLPAKKVSVGRPSVTLRVRGQKDIVIYDKHINTSNKTKEKQKRLRTQSPNKSESNENPIARSHENTLILSTKHKINSPPGNAVNGAMAILPNETANGVVEKERYMCLCSKPSRYYTRRVEEHTYCAAVDQIENEQIGCSNKVKGDLLNLLRPSVRVSYKFLCDSHKRRLQAHNCCAGCGIFCTQGRFILCSQNHFFHRECANKFILTAPFDPHRPNFIPMLVLKCPHCGVDAPEKETFVMMRCGSVPVFTASQKILPKPAKMSIGLHSYRSLGTREELFLMDLEKLIPEQVTANLMEARNRFTFTQGPNFTNKDVFLAIRQNDIDRMAEIIASGFDITTPLKEFHDGTCLHLAANIGSVKIIYLILSRVSSMEFLNLTDKKHRTAIMCAILGSKIDILKVLIQCGADITLKGPDGMTALHLAAKTGNVESARLMLNSYRESASIYNLEKFLNTCDDGGWTSIVWAAEIGNAEIVSALLNAGANANIGDAENNTALHWATLSNNFETVMLLVQNGCNVGTQNINGDTPLHIACRNDNVRISLLLLAHGANLDITNNANEAPYDCITDENGSCGRAIFFNLQIRNIAGFPEQNIICQDISNGRELYPIQIIGRKRYRNTNKNGMASNELEFNDQIIPDFKYITKTILLQNSVQIDRRVSQMRICSCLDNCTTQNCQCSEISIQNWYNSEGRLNNEFNFLDPAMIFECNDVCGCNKLMCKNRVVQNGSKVPLQIFECDEKIKGLGVKALIKIPRGTFVAEYTGEILTDVEADRRTDDSYFFDLGASGHCIDANFYGNVSRFFNHSCEPNVVPIRVYFEHQDLRFPKIAFFSSHDIEAGEEITFDYGEKFWLIKYKLFTCRCETTSCRFSEQNIVKTLDEYNQRKENT